MKFKCLHVNKKKKSMKHDQGKKKSRSTEQSSYLKRINYTLKSSIKKYINKEKNTHIYLHLLTLYTLNYCQKKPFKQLHTIYI